MSEELRKFDYDGIDALVSTENGEEYTDLEIEGYIRRGIQEHGRRLSGMTIHIHGSDVDIHYVLKYPFERIRRITGYLVGTTDRFNNAKQSEEHDRVKHNM